MTWVGWMDTMMAQGALNRWATSDVPMVVIIGPWGHDAASDANPFLPRDSELALPQAEQQAITIEYLDQYLKHAGEPARERKIVYFTLAENAWKETRQWPPKGTLMTPMYLRAEHALSRQAPSGAEPADDYQVDFTASTGSENGWWTKLGSADVYYGDRSSEDQKLLVYTSAPFKADTEITGHPQVTTGVLQEVTLGLYPTSVLIRRGHSLRVAIAGHDASIFARTPSTGTPTLTVAHSAAHPSRIDLPITRRRSHHDGG
jgi:uncharacterized protein